MTYHLAIFFVGLVLLWAGADRFIKGSYIIAKNLGMSGLLIGLTLGALGTSLPELIVSWMAAGVGRTSISIGNAVGSNMANIGLALGLGALICPIPVEKEVIKYDYWVLLLSGVVLYLFSMNLHIVSFEGAIMVLLFVAYIIFLAARGYRNRFGEQGKDVQKQSIIKGIFYFVVGLAALGAGGKLVVDRASDIARAWGVTGTVIGITVVAVGTSLPEIAVVVAGSIRKLPEISIGTIVGSNIFNILLIAGGASIISEIPLAPNEVIIQAPAVILLTLFLLPIIISDRKITRFEGGLLFAAYGMYFYFII
jgi:cation:H+ antiporter